MEAIIRAVGAGVQDVIIEDIEDLRTTPRCDCASVKKSRTLISPQATPWLLAVAFDCPIFVADKVLKS